jgi:hypothetical protein
LIIFNVVVILPRSTLIYNFVMISSVRHKCAVAFPVVISFVISFFYILINIKFKHVTSTCYHRLYLVFEFSFNVTYFHRVVDT